MTTETKHTAGPWRWEFNPSTKGVQLCGGRPQFDLTVMDFVRVGMNGAGPRVRDGSGIDLMTKATAFRKVAEGREHHAGWFMLLRHPDLDLIAAAPDLAEALRMVVAAMVDYEMEAETEAPESHREMMRKARAALAKAGVK